MIVFHCSGARPRILNEAMLGRIAHACSGVRGLPKRGTATIGLRFVTPTEMQRLNRIYRGKDCPTDVLSFAAEEGEAFPTPGTSREAREVGDLVVCPAVATREAKRRLIQPVEELVRLIVHGTLHLAGMDHANQKDEEKMFILQETIIEKVV